MRTLLLCLVLAGALPCQDQPLPDGASLVIVVQEVKGEVDVRTGPKEKWVPAVAGMRIPVGSKICTGIESGAVVSFGTNSVALVSECTVCSIQTFEMRGEELVAGIHLEPGVAQVSVKQLAQFHTDFQVSTPRLTCSVRGSVGWFVSQCDEIPDVVRNEEGHVGANGRNLAAGERTNSNRESNHELDLKDNVADTTPDGATDNEQNADQIANNAGNLDPIASDSTNNTSASPSGGDNPTNGEPPVPGCDPGQIAADEAFLIEHGLGALVFFLQTGDPGHFQQAQDEFDGINTQLNEDPIFQDKHAAIHRLYDCSAFGTQLQDNHGLNFPVEHTLLHALVAEFHLDQHAFHGVDLDRHEQDHSDLMAMHNTAHSDGMAAMATFTVNGLRSLFNEEMALNTGLTQGDRDTRTADYTGAAIVGEIGFQARMDQLAAETSNGAPGGFDGQTYGEALLGILHAGGHIAIAASPSGFSPGGYDIEHQDLHNVINPLLGTLDSDGVHVLVQDKAGVLHQYWHDQTGIPHPVTDGQFGFEAHEALHGALDEFLDAGTQAADASDQGQ